MGRPDSVFTVAVILDTNFNAHAAEREASADSRGAVATTSRAATATRQAGRLHPKGQSRAGCQEGTSRSKGPRPGGGRAPAAPKPVTIEALRAATARLAGGKVFPAPIKEVVAGPPPSGPPLQQESHLSPEKPRYRLPNSDQYINLILTL